MSDDFIEVFDGAVPADVCAALCRQFDADGRVGRGLTAGGLDTSHKDSWDICLNGKPNWSDVEQALNSTMLNCLLHYVRKYPYAVLGPHWLNITDPDTGQKKALDAETLMSLPDDTLRAVVTKAFRPGPVNLQKYVADVGGYPRWHCETGPKADRGESLHRWLLWTLYLNDGFGEGETEFFHQRRKFVPKTGSMLIAPAGFTHTHRGNMPKGGDKYIATSWILFQRAEPL